MSDFFGFPLHYLIWYQPDDYDPPRQSVPPVGANMGHNLTGDPAKCRCRGRACICGDDR